MQMKGLYALSVLIAFLSLLPVVILTIRASRRCRTVHMVLAVFFSDKREFEQRVREVWWEAHFSGDKDPDRVIAVCDGDEKTKAVCERLTSELKGLEVLSEEDTLKVCGEYCIIHRD